MGYRLPEQNQVMKGQLACVSFSSCHSRLAVVVQLLSPVQLFEMPWTTAHQVSLSFTISSSTTQFAQTPVKWVTPSNNLILCHPFSSYPQSFFPSIKVFSSELALCIRWPKYYGFSISISPSNEYSGLISFRIDWFDLLVVQGTLKSLLQHHSWKASILQHSAFFMGQLSHSYMTTGKTIDLILWIFVIKVMVLLFNTLSRFLIAFLPRCKCLFLFQGCSYHPQWFWSPRK